MDVWTRTYRDPRGQLATLLILANLLPPAGCSRPDDDLGNAAPYAASGGLAPAADVTASGDSERMPVAAESDLPLAPPADASAPGPDLTPHPGQGSGDRLASNAPLAGVTPQDTVAPGNTNSGSGDVRPTDAGPAAANNPAAAGKLFQTQTPTDVAPRLELRPNLSPKQLVASLAEMDAAIMMIRNGESGITDQQEARKELLRVIKLKLEASRQLSRHADSAPEMVSDGSRGEMQALSHLASLGDLKAAQELEPLAEKNLQSADPLLATDSRLVLLGFAIESLKNGRETSSAKIVELVKGFGESNPTTDVPALMVLGQARFELAQYGYEKESRIIRKTILDLFANSPDKQIAELAAQAAGNVSDDAVNMMLAAAVRGDEVTEQQWSQAVEKLITESPDLQTVQYLAGAALELESLGSEALVAATFRSLEKHFDDPSSAAGNEVALAIDARQARQQIIGWTFEVDYPGADGRPLNMDDYQGRVVLVPFWAMNFPHSLTMVPKLDAIVEANPETVSIVGMNLDVEGMPVARFLESAELGFPSLRCASSPTDKIANPMAARFGMVSMPFLAILDKKGKVAAIKLSTRDLEETVQRIFARD